MDGNPPRPILRSGRQGNRLPIGYICSRNVRRCGQPSKTIRPCTSSVRQYCSTSCSLPRLYRSAGRRYPPGKKPPRMPARRSISCPYAKTSVPATVRQVTRCLEEATALNASCVVIDMNTYGGVLDAADSIRTMLLDDPAPTIAFINNQAARYGSADCPRRRQHLHAPRRKHRSSHGGRRKRRSDARQVSEFHALHDACHGRGARPGSLGRTGRHGVAVAARPANSRGHGEPFDSRSRPY